LLLTYLPQFLHGSFSNALNDRSIKECLKVLTWSFLGSGDLLKPGGRMALINEFPEFVWLIINLLSAIIAENGLTDITNEQFQDLTTTCLHLPEQFSFPAFRSLVLGRIISAKVEDMVIIRKDFASAISLSNPTKPVEEIFSKHILCLSWACLQFRAGRLSEANAMLEGLDADACLLRKALPCSRLELKIHSMCLHNMALIQLMQPCIGKVFNIVNRMNETAGQLCKRDNIYKRCIDLDSWVVQLQGEIEYDDQFDELRNRGSDDGAHQQTTPCYD